MEKYNDSSWNIEQFQIYASQVTDEVAREILQLNSEISDKAALVLRHRGDVSQLVHLAEKLPQDAIHLLDKNPSQLGALQGGPFDSTARRMALEEARRLSDIIWAREDKRVVLSRYEDMWKEAHKARALPAHEQAAATERLHGTRDYCDTTRSVRESEHRQRIEATKAELDRWKVEKDRAPAPQKREEVADAISRLDDDNWYEHVNNPGKVQEARAPEIERQLEPERVADRSVVDDSEASIQRQALVNSSRLVGPPEVDERNRPTPDWMRKREEILREEEERIRGGR